LCFAPVAFEGLSLSLPSTLHAFCLTIFCSLLSASLATDCILLVTHILAATHVTN